MWKEMKGPEEVIGVGGKAEDMNERKRQREGRRKLMAVGEKEDGEQG